MINEKQRNILKKNNEESRAITREAIRGALLYLIKEKSFHDISITQIINKSGVSRSAFYRNYNSKDEILFDTMDSFFKKMISSLGRNLENNLRIIYLMINENYDTLKILVEANLEYHILDILNKHITYGNNRYEAYIWNGFLYNIIVEWIKNPSDKDINDIIKEIMDNFINISNIIVTNNGNFSNDISYHE